IRLQVAGVNEEELVLVQLNLDPPADCDHCDTGASVVEEQVLKVAEGAHQDRQADVPPGPGVGSAAGAARGPSPDPGAAPARGPSGSSSSRNTSNSFSADTDAPSTGRQICVSASRNRLRR